MSGEGGAIAEVLAAHEYALEMRRGSICRCGFIPTVQPETLQTQQDYHREHIAEVLADLLAAERQRGREEALREAADDLIRQRDDFEVEDRAEGCESRFCAGWLLGQLHAAEVLQKLAQRKGQR